MNPDKSKPDRPNPPTQVQIEAAKLRVTLDKRLGRETPKKVLDLVAEADKGPTV